MFYPKHDLTRAVRLCNDYGIKPLRLEEEVKDYFKIEKLIASEAKRLFNSIKFKISSIGLRSLKTTNGRVGIMILSDKKKMHIIVHDHKGKEINRELKYKLINKVNSILNKEIRLL